MSEGAVCFGHQNVASAKWLWAVTVRWVRKNVITCQPRPTAIIRDERSPTSHKTMCVTAFAKQTHLGLKL